MSRGGHARRSTRRWRIAVSVVVAVLILGSASKAFAYWLVTGRGDATARAATLGQPQLHASSAGNTVTLRISPPRSGPTPSGYLLAWTAGGNGTGGTCRASLSGGTCWYTGVSSGRYVYTLRARLGARWTSRAVATTVVVRCARDGSGRFTTGTRKVLAGTAGNTIDFVYTADPGGMTDGSLSFDVPSGWSAPSIDGNAGGYVTASDGQVSIHGDNITVSHLTLLGGEQVTVTYGSTRWSGPGASAPTRYGTVQWPATERSTPGGHLTALASPPSVTVEPAPDGTGTWSASTPKPLQPTGDTITFTYTAPPGGLDAGTVEVTLPAGWAAPSTRGDEPGYTTVSSGVETVSGQTVTVSGVTLTAGSTLVIVYGATSAGGPGASATLTTAPTWLAAERSSASGRLTDLPPPPVRVTGQSDEPGHSPDAATPTTTTTATTSTVPVVSESTTTTTTGTPGPP